MKPANIILDADGEPKIVDFGLARVGLGPRATASGDFVGTPAYTSPKQGGGPLQTSRPLRTFSPSAFCYSSVCRSGCRS